MPSSLSKEYGALCSGGRVPSSSAAAAALGSGLASEGLRSDCGVAEAPTLLTATRRLGVAASAS